VSNTSVSLMSLTMPISRSRSDRLFNSRIRFRSLRLFPLSTSHAHPPLPVVVSSWAQPFLFSLSADLFPSAQCDAIYYWGNTREKTCSDLGFSTKPTRFIFRIFTSRFSIKSHLPCVSLRCDVFQKETCKMSHRMECVAVSSCVAVRCSAFLRVAVCVCVAVRCSVLLRVVVCACVAMRCSVLLHVAVCACVAVRCSVLRKETCKMRHYIALCHAGPDHRARFCPQHTATHPTHRNTPQHTATHWMESWSTSLVTNELLYIGKTPAAMSHSIGLSVCCSVYVRGGVLQCVAVCCGVLREETCKDKASCGSLGGND